MKLYLLAALSLLLSAPALAQTATWGNGNTPEPTWTGAGLGDGVTLDGGPAPYDAIEPAKIATTIDTTGLITPFGVDYEPNTSGVNDDKFRIVCGPSTSGFIDPILAPGVDFWHYHGFSGSFLVNKNSTYQTLRQEGNGSCPGKGLNPTPYWETAIVKEVGGALIYLKHDRDIHYYQNPQNMRGKYRRIPRGLRMVYGWNPADPDDSIRKSKIPAGYIDQGNGKVGWLCVNPATGQNISRPEGGVYSDGFVTAAGGDPWAGQCKKGFQLIGEMNAPECWNGKQATTTDGRSHMTMALRKAGGDPLKYCPDNSWIIPGLQNKRIYSLAKDAEYFVDNWRLSSDVMPGRPLQTFKPGAPPTSYRPGTTLHADWFGAWDDYVLERFQNRCLAIKIGGVEGVGADCDFATISATERLETGIPQGSGSTVPVVVAPDRANLPAKQRWWPVPARAKFTGHIRGH